MHREYHTVVCGKFLSLGDDSGDDLGDNVDFHVIIATHTRHLIIQFPAYLMSNFFYHIR